MLSLRAEELIRRVLQHVLPAGLVCIRYYGLLANRHRGEAQQPCREALAAPSPEEELLEEALPSWACPLCGEGNLRIVERTSSPEAPTTLPREKAPPCRAA